MCEYCLTHESDSVFPFEVDHIIGLQHGGKTDLENLAYACAFCNKLKGPNIATVNGSGGLVRLFNPRCDEWHDHFRIDGPIFEPLTEVAECTARLLQLNAAWRIKIRAVLQAARRIPRN
jgi:hypothetical protein